MVVVAGAGVVVAAAAAGGVVVVVVVVESELFESELFELSVVPSFEVKSPSSRLEPGGVQPEGAGVTRTAFAMQSTSPTSNQVNQTNEHAPFGVITLEANSQRL